MDKKPGTPVDSRAPTAAPGPGGPSDPTLLDHPRPGPAATPPEVAAAPADARVGKFVRVSPIETASGEAWKAWDTDLRRWVSLVMLPRADDREADRRIHDAEAAAVLVHPNIAAIYEAGRVDSGSYIASEPVDAVPLRAYARKEPATVVLLVREAADALHFAHEQGFVHSDLQPANLLVDRSDDANLRVMIAGFGLGATSRGMASLATSHRSSGSAAYMSPEQGRGERPAPPADIWSLGVTLYEMLSGRPPFAGTNVVDTIRRIQSEEPAPPSALDSSIARDLDHVILRCLEKDASKRPTAFTLAQDLDRVLAGDGVITRPGAMSTIGKAFGRRRRFLAIVAVLLLLGGTVAAIVVPYIRTANAQMIEQLRKRAEGSLKSALALRRAGTAERFNEFAVDADAACREVGKLLPARPEPHYLRGRMLRAVMQDGAALVEQEEALRKDPSFAPARYERLVLVFRRFQARADTLVSTARRTEAAVAPAELVRADAQARSLLDRLRDDLAALSKEAKGVAPAQVECARGLCAVAEGDAEPARKLLAGAIALSSDIEEAYEALAGLETQQGRFEDSLRWWDEGLNHDQGYAPHRVGRGSVCLELAFAESRRGNDPEPLLKRAIEDFERAMAAAPHLPDAVLKLGTARLETGVALMARGENPESSYKSAIALFDAAMAFDAKDADPWQRRGRAKANWSSWKAHVGEDSEPLLREAIDDLAQAVARRDDSEESWLMAARLYLMWGALLKSRGKDPLAPVRTAVDDCDRALRLNPLRDDGWRLRAAARLELARLSRGEEAATRFSEAIKDANEAVKLAPESVGARLARADVWRTWADAHDLAGENAFAYYRNAIDDCDEALKRDTKSFAAWYARGMTHGNWTNPGIGLTPAQRLELDRKAIGDFTEAVKYGSRQPAAWIARARARVHHAQRLPEEKRDEMLKFALKDLERALELSPSSAEATALRAEARMLAGASAESCEEAIRDLDALLAANPRDVDTLVKRGTARLRLAQLKAAAPSPGQLVEQAIQDFEAALGLKPGRIDALRGRALARRFDAGLRQGAGLESKEAWGKAIDQCSEWLDAVPGDADALGNRGIIRSAMATIQLQKREDPLLLFSLALQDLDASLAKAPDAIEIRSVRAATFGNKGAWLRSKGKDATEPCRAAVEDATIVLKARPDDIGSLVVRSNANIALLNQGIARRESPKEEARSALADMERLKELQPEREGTVQATIDQLNKWLKDQEKP